MSGKLSPCPFCGTTSEDGVVDCQPTDKLGYWFCGCYNCGTCGPVEKGEKKARAAWNTRHPRGAQGMSLQEKELRELDAWIAEHVMGWQWTPYDAELQGEGRYLMSPGGWSGVQHWAKNEPRYFDWLPCYSTDISAAFEVVEKMHEKGFGDFTLNRFEDHANQWQAIFGDDAASPDCATPALAICLAARAAIEPKGI